MDHTFSDCLLQILLVRGPGVGRALPHDLVLFLLPAAVACTEMDSSEYIHGSNIVSSRAPPSGWSERERRRVWEITQGRGVLKECCGQTTNGLSRFRRAHMSTQECNTTSQLTKHF